LSGKITEHLVPVSKRAKLKRKNMIVRNTLSSHRQNHSSILELPFTKMGDAMQRWREK